MRTTCLLLWFLDSDTWAPIHKRTNSAVWGALSQAYHQKKVESVMQQWTIPVAFRALITVFVLWFAASPTRAADNPAEHIIKSAGVRGGLVVHLGCGDGRLTAALRASDAYVVHGLDTDAGQVANAREHIRSKGLYGSVSVETFDGKRLPYVDNLVNLLVAEELGEVSMDEVMRVLAPLGVAYVNQNGQWQKTVKQRPEEIDEWTHYLYDASGNAVSRDQLAGPTRHLRWIAGPIWSRSHEYTPSMAAMVSAGGKIISIHDDGVRGIIDPCIGDRWMIHVECNRRSGAKSG